MKRTNIYLFLLLASPQHPTSWACKFPWDSLIIIIPTDVFLVWWLIVTCLASCHNLLMTCQPPKGPYSHLSLVSLTAPNHSLNFNAPFLPPSEIKMPQSHLNPHDVISIYTFLKLSLMIAPQDPTLQVIAQFLTVSSLYLSLLCPKSLSSITACTFLQGRY